MSKLHAYIFSALILTGVFPACRGEAAEQAQVLTLVNRERAAQELAPLELNEKLNKIAAAKSEDMRKLQYFAHRSPTYGDLMTMVHKLDGPTYRAYGENIAKGQKTAQRVMTDWMNSRGHRKNIMDPAYTQLGIGYVSNDGEPLWTQIFAGDNVAARQPSVLGRLFGR